MVVVKLLFIGQAPGKPRFAGDTPGRAFDPIFSQSGRRLAKLTSYRFMATHEFVNLFQDWTGRDDSSNPKGDAFPLKAARERADELKQRFHGREVILVGENVASAFGLKAPLFFGWRQFPGIECCKFTVIPHPSGVNRWWSDEKNMESAERFFKKLKRELLERGEL